MKNSMFDYSWHYSHWHTDTIESKQNDINYAKWLFQTQGIYPSDHGKVDLCYPDLHLKILEIGCGMGRFLLHLREQGYTNLVGIDIDESQYQIAKKEGLNVFLDDATTFLLNDTSNYNTIYAFDVLEHIEKKKQLSLLRLIFERLDDNGMFVVQVPNALAPTAAYFRYIDFTHTISYTEHSLGFLLHNAGFHNFCIQATHNESLEIQRLKVPWAKLYKNEFGIQEPILTPNLIAIIFKNKESYQKWKQHAPIIKNAYEYDITPRSNITRLRSYIKKKWKKLHKK
ncbi:class I SAM-dependent methyltransferase [Helicobacter trogontum]|uniref:class I SAM-dependent methyltransferase n=1 Tax=Helicobacter trogontum TaxID=50960 RepID=UPI000CF17B31|nr:class I SAM-dependent methyltransferase [Helicobacter trogontum]